MSEFTVKNSATPFASGGLLVAMLISSMLLVGCYSTAGHVPDKTRFPESVPSGSLDFKEDKMESGKDALPVARRLALSDAGAPKLYSFMAMGQSLRVSLVQFAEANKLNMILDQDVTGVVNVEFHDVTLEQALDSILDPIGLGWVQEDGMIRIVRQVTQTYQVDYLRAARSGNASMSATSSGQNSSGTNSISKNDSIDFWAELETEIKSLMTKANAEDGQQSKPQAETTSTTNSAGVVTVSSRPIQQVEGRITINKIAGTVQVTTSPRRMKAINSFMESLLKGINRQVYIEARILDVTLNDDNALGINWTNVATKSGLTLSSSNVVTMAGSVAAPATTGILALNRSTPNGLFSNIAGAIDALAQQGSVRVLSQPKVRTLNNQPAIMKVGTDRTFYNVTTTAPTVQNNTTIPGTTTETPTTVTEGVMLSVTPQISADGLITMDVMPVINKIVGVDTSPSGLSNAAQVETTQTSTLVRLKDGETAVIGGMIEEDDSETARNVPGLGNLPGVGWLFKGKYSNKLRRELVIFITPHLVEN